DNEDNKDNVIDNDENLIDENDEEFENESINQLDIENKFDECLQG
ncbi:9391_t:CDS:1, partial [Diversispora eburnea]